MRGNKAKAMTAKSSTQTIPHNEGYSQDSRESIGPVKSAPELAIALSDDDGENVASMDSACRLIHDLLDQVASRDAPPNNEETEFVSLVAQRNMGQLSKQCHVQPSVPKNSLAIPSHGSIESDDPSNQWDIEYAKRSNISEKKMGNVSLATLCARTLETVGKSSSTTNDKHVQFAPVPAKMRKDFLKRRKKQRSKKAFPWRQKKPQMDAANTHFGEIVLSTRESKAGAAEENRGASHTSSTLQMFGSEYARHLSTTPLAPTSETPSIRNKATPKPKNMARRYGAKEIYDIEDAELSALTGPITDIVVTFGDESPPKGYFRISQSVSGERIILHDRKEPVYINVKKETNWDRAAQRPCVTALAIVFPSRKEFIPPGFSVVGRFSPASKDSSRSPVNLGGDDEEVYLCFRRSREGNPITAILPVMPTKKECIPEGFTVLEHTPRNSVAAIQAPTGLTFLAYRQRLANLELLRPLPLVMSAHRASLISRSLNGYYCTGGTVVESRVGRFHIMDRSTHSMVSKSSISARLSIIEASRRKTLNSISKLDAFENEGYVYSSKNPSDRIGQLNNSLTPSLLLAHGLGTPGSRSVISDLEKLSSIGDESDLTSEHRSGLTGLYQGPTSNSNESFSSRTSRSFHDEISSKYGSEDPDLLRCLDVMSFIPVVSTAIDENDPHGMLSFQARVTVITPILTACYTRHGGSSLLAVEGLMHLLEWGFFSNDIHTENDDKKRITLLDIVIQVVCDVATMGTQEAQLHACVEFVQSAVECGCGHLNTRTTGYVMRFYLYIFYFGVTTATNTPGAWGCTKGSDHFLLEDPRHKGQSYLPGGAPQASILSMKDLIAFSVDRVKFLIRRERIAFQMETPRQHDSTVGPFNPVIAEVLDDVVDESVHRVEMANYTQLALHQIRRSGGSELFWYEMMNSCGSGLFGTDSVASEELRNAYSTLFAMLATSVKTASAKIRKGKDGESVARDIASKLMGLEMLRFFLQKLENSRDSLHITKSHSFDTIVYSVRRLVVPCLLFNTRGAVDDPRIYRRIIQVVGVLWSSSTYRSKMKLELGLLMEHFVIRILSLGPQILYQRTAKDEEDMTYLFAQQIELMRSLQQWFTDARGLLELFLNFDTKTPLSHGHGVSTGALSNVQWKITQKMFGILCNAAETCGDFIAGQISQNTLNLDSYEDEELDGVSGTTLARESAQRLRKHAFDALEQIVRGLAESTAATKGPRFRSLIESWDPTRNRMLSRDEGVNVNYNFENGEHARNTEDTAILGFWQRAIVEREENSKDENIDTTFVDHFDIAMRIARSKSIQKALDYLIACNELTSSPRDIASFLRLHRSSLDPAALGKYLGEAGIDISHTEYWNMIRFSYLRAISFAGLTIEQALRHLLTNAGFRLPGEAQQVDRIISTFAQCFWEDNAGDPTICPFGEQDVVFLVSFATIMLNTDLHKTATGPKKTKKGASISQKMMSKSEFISNLQSAIGKMEPLSPEYLSHIYDSIEAMPIVMTGEDATFFSDTVSISSSDRLSMTLSSMVDNGKSLDALLRALSTQEHKFSSIEDYSTRECFGGDISRATSTLARNIMVQNWHEFHGLINGVIEKAHLDMSMMDTCSTILKYLLSLTVCLDMPVETTAFLNQLGRFRLFHAWRRGESTDHSASEAIDLLRKEDWFTGIEEASADVSPSASKKKLMSLELIDDLIMDLGLSITVSVEGQKAMKRAVQYLSNAEYLLNDPTRTFIRRGHLMKRANRSGRLAEYQFFLFSDTVIYGKKLPNSKQYKIHEELPLILMKVVDWFPPEHKREAKKGFQIYHPKKTFMVYAAKREERDSWVATIRQAIDKEVQQKMNMAAARQVANTHG